MDVEMHRHEEVRLVLEHACQLSQILDLQLVSIFSRDFSADLGTQLLSLHHLLLQIVDRFNSGIALLQQLFTTFHPQHQPSVVTISPPQSPNRIVPLVEIINSGTDLLMSLNLPVNVETPPKPAVTAAKMQAGPENGMKTELDQTICKKRRVDHRSKRPNSSTRSKILPGGSTSDVDAKGDLIDSSGDDEQHTNSNGPLKNSRTGSQPRRTVRFQGNQFIDSYTWKKYGQKNIHGTNYPRSYYRCGHIHCPVKKQVQQCDDEASAFVVTYIGNHTCRSVHLEDPIMAVRNAAPGSANLPGLFPLSRSDGLLLINEQDSAAAPLLRLPSFETLHSSSSADLQHQLELEPETIHGVWEAFSNIGPSSLSAQTILSDFSFSGCNEVHTSMLTEIQELPIKRDLTWDQSKPRRWQQQYQDLHPPSVELTECLFGTKESSLSSVTPGIRSQRVDQVVNRDHSFQQAESEATSLISKSQLSPPLDFIADYFLSDMEA